MNWQQNANATTGRFSQVRLSKGGGLRSMHVVKTSKKVEIISQALEIFFPNGSSSVGNRTDFNFDLTDFQIRLLTRV